MKEEDPAKPIVDVGFWEGHWQEGHTPWDRGEVSPALSSWLADGAVAGPRVLVPGAGSGHEVVALAQVGYRVTAVDLARTATVRLQQTLDSVGVSAAVVQADLLDWQPDEPFDTVYEQTCLCALDPDHWPAYEARLARWIRPGGTLLALFMQTEHSGGPPYHCGLNAMRRLFDARRWRWPDSEPAVIPHHGLGMHELAVRLERRETPSG